MTSLSLARLSSTDFLVPLYEDDMLCIISHYPHIILSGLFYRFVHLRSSPSLSLLRPSPFAVPLSSPPLSPLHACPSYWTFPPLLVYSYLVILLYSVLPYSHFSLRSLLNVNTILWASLPFGSVYIQACRDVSASLLIKGTVSWYFSGSFSESWTGLSSLTVGW